jgi:DNA modification methylase
MSAYLDLLKSKSVIAQTRGMEPGELNANLKPHARDIAAWMIRGGNRACFASFGLHKTSIQLQILESIVGMSRMQYAQLGLEAEADRPSGLIICPLGVKHEFVREAKARKFSFDPVYVRTNEELDELQGNGHRHFLTNYERVRDGALDPNRFLVCSLDEAAVLRSFGSKTYQTFLTLFDKVPFKFVATATPDPNRHKELIHYAGFLGIMDTGQALTRFFKRDSTQAGNLQIHPHKEEEFWLWVSTWACFLDRPSDLGYSDDGYVLPKLNIHRHRLPVDHLSAGADSWGQGRMFREAAVNLSAAAREKRDSLQTRVLEASRIVDANPGRNWIIWHDLEDERRALEGMFPEATTVYGTQDIDERETAIAAFSDGELPMLATKLSIAGSGTNMQRHCYSAIYLGINFKFNDFIQGLHRILRFGQTHEVDIYLIYNESEDRILDTMMEKWDRHTTQVRKMSELIRKYGLNSPMKEAAMQRAITEARAEEKGERYTLVNSDNVPETQRMEANSVDLIITSWPFSDHYEYTELYNDFGHNDGDKGFFEQMEFLTPELKRILKPGRMYCVHAKDRLVYGSVSGLGMYSVNPFSDKCVAHLQAHGLIYCGRITIVTDVVRENNQTYRLGWTEKCKDGTKMGVGSPEYLLLFRKLPSDQSRSYADTPVVKQKPQYTTVPISETDGQFDAIAERMGATAIELPVPGTGYSRSRWQFDASPFWRSSGNRFLTPAEIKQLPTDSVRKLWHEFNKTHIYDFEEHVAIAEHLEKQGLLPASFMLLDPTSHSPWVWDDVVRMRTLNTDQSRKRQEQHVCPLQLDIVERLMETYSNPGELVLDPFAGLGTVPFVAVQTGRRGYGIELNSAYWVDSVGYCRSEEQKVLSPTLFDAL